MAQLAVDKEVVGLATSHIIGLRSLGGASALFFQSTVFWTGIDIAGSPAGAAIATAIFTPKISAFLPARTAEYASRAGVPTSSLTAVVTAVLTAPAGTTPSVPGVTAAQIAAAQAGSLQAYADAFAYIYYSIIPWAVLAAACLCCLRSVKDAMSWKIDRAVEREEVLMQHKETVHA